MKQLLVCFMILLNFQVLDCVFSPIQAEELEDILDGFDENDIRDKPDNMDEVLSGFEEVNTGLEQVDVDGLVKEERLFPRWFSVSGGVNQVLSYNFAHDAPEVGQVDSRGFTRFRSSLDVQADLFLADNWKGRIGAKFFYDSVYSLRGRNDYTDAVLDAYEDEAELTEVYLQGTLLPQLDLKVGRQVVVWGKSDNIRVTDIINPLDNREPGVVDIRDLRLPVTMTKLDYYQGDWNLSAIVLHESRFSKNPVFGNDFFPGHLPPPSEQTPVTSLDNQEYALAVNGVFSGWDLSFYLANVYNDRAHQEQIPTGIVLRHDRINMAGVALNIASGNWLFKGEAAYFDDLRYLVDVEPKNRLDVLLGAEYTGLSETVISLEVVNRHIFSFDKRLKQAPSFTQENEIQTVLRVSKDYLHDTLRLTMMLSTFGVTTDGGSFQRFTTQYDWSDNLSLTAGIIFYQQGDKALFRRIEDNDRLFAELRYTF